MPNLNTTPSAEGKINREWYGGRVAEYMECQVSVASSDTEVNLPKTIPANSRVLWASMKFATAVGLATAVKVGLGTAADPDGILLSGTTVTKNTETVGLPKALTSFTSDTTLQVACVDTNGADAGTFNAAATFYVRIYYEVMESTPDAD